MEISINIECKKTRETFAEFTPNHKKDGRPEMQLKEIINFGKTIDV